MSMPTIDPLVAATTMDIAITRPARPGSFFRNSATCLTAVRPPIWPKVPYMFVVL